MSGRKRIVKRAKKAYNSMPKPNANAQFDEDYVGHAFGLPKNEIRRLRKLRDELADAGIVAPNPFPYSEPDGYGGELYFVHDIITWHNKRIDALVARGVEAYQDVVNELRTTAAARNVLLVETLDKLLYAETLVNHWKLESQ